MQVGQARAARPAARSASGCTSSCTSRADRNCVSIDMFCVERLAKWRTRSISPTSGSGGGASARRAGRQQLVERHVGHVALRQTACARRPGLAQLEQQLRSIGCCRMDAVTHAARGVAMPCFDRTQRAAAASPSISARVRFSVTATQQAVGQFGIPAAQRQAGVIARVEHASASSSATSAWRVADDELLEERPLERAGDTPATSASCSAA